MESQFNENDFLDNNYNDNLNENENNNLVNDVINDSNQNHEVFQENLFEQYLTFNDDLDIELFVNPLIFYYNYDNVKYYDMGKKVLAPKFLLHKLSKYNNIEYPIYLKINNTIFTVHDFVEDIDCVYIPTPIFYNIFLEENTIHPIIIMKNIPPKASSLKMKPLSEELYSIKDVKKFFEIHLTKLYASVHKFEIVKIPYRNTYIEFKITDCKPENIVSLNEIEELQLEFEPLIEKQEQTFECTYDSDESLSNSDQNQKDLEKDLEKEENNKSNNKTFIPFSGKGNKLGSN